MTSVISDSDKESWMKTLTESEQIVNSNFKTPKQKAEELVAALTSKISESYENVEFIEKMIGRLEKLRSDLVIGIRKNGSMLNEWLSKSKEDELDIDGFLDE